MVFPREQDTMWDAEPQSLISKFADCSLSQDQIPIPNRPAARGCERYLSQGREPRVHPVGHALELPGARKGVPCQKVADGVVPVA
jgi:hypothetical protein